MAVLKDDLGDLLIFLKMWLRDLLVWRQNGMQPGKGLAELPGNQGKLLKSWSSGHVFAKLQAVEMAEKALARNCNRLLVCEIVLFRLLESGKTGVTLMPYF
jgi:DNA polymerase-3 subunit delta'